MSLEGLRALSRVHAVVAWLATIALVAAAASHLVARARRFAAAIGALALALSMSAVALGLGLHDGYRARLRQRLFVTSASLGWLFERKQHLALAAVMLALSGLAVSLLLRRAEARGDHPARSRELGRAALVAWISAAAFAIFAAVASVIVGRRSSF